MPLPYDVGALLLSAAAIAKPPVYDRARAVARNSSTMRELVQSFKYRDRHEGPLLFRRRRPHRAGAALRLAALVAALQPIAMLAHAVGRRARVFVDCFALERVRRTASQVGLSADQGRRNVAGAFKVPQAETGRIKG